MPSANLVALSSPTLTFMGRTFNRFEGVIIERMDARVPQLSTVAVCATGTYFMVASSQFPPENRGRLQRTV